MSNRKELVFLRTCTSLFPQTWPQAPHWKPTARVAPHVTSRYRQYTRPQAANGLFRLRTSPGFRVATAYGHLSADPKYDNLYHIQGCDEYKCFAFDCVSKTGSLYGRALLFFPGCQLTSALWGWQIGTEKPHPLSRWRLRTPISLLFTMRIAPQSDGVCGCKQFRCLLSKPDLSFLYQLFLTAPSASSFTRHRSFS